MIKNEEVSTFFKKYLFLGLPWWSSGLKSTLQCRGHWFDFWSGKILHAAGLLSPCSGAWEPQLLKRMRSRACALQQEKPPQWKAYTLQLEKATKPKLNKMLKIPICLFGRVLVAFRIFSCRMWNLVPWLGIEPGSPALGVWRLSPWTTMEVPCPLFLSKSV